MFGQALRDRCGEVTAVDDNTLRFRLKTPFEILPDALAQLNGGPCFVLPERLASPDLSKIVTEAVRSGPFKFVADEFVPGERSVYAKNAECQPRQEKPENNSGGKVVYFERIEWQTIADPATAAAALQNGEIDWWETVQFDVVDLLRSSRDVTVATADPGATRQSRVAPHRRVRDFTERPSSGSHLRPITMERLLFGVQLRPARHETSRQKPDGRQQGLQGVC